MIDDDQDSQFKFKKRMSMLFDIEYVHINNLPPIPKNYKYNTSKITQLSYCLFDKNCGQIKFNNMYIKPEDSLVERYPEHHTKSKIRTKVLIKDGIPLRNALEQMIQDIERCGMIISHGLEQDMSIVKCEMYRHQLDETVFDKIDKFCTMKVSKNIVKAVDRNGKIKMPRVDEIYHYYMQIPMDLSNNHNALFDCRNTLLSYLMMINLHDRDKGLELIKKVRKELIIM